MIDLLLCILKMTTVYYMQNYTVLFYREILRRSIEFLVFAKIIYIFPSFLLIGNHISLVSVAQREVDRARIVVFLLCNDDL